MSALSLRSSMVEQNSEEVLVISSNLILGNSKKGNGGIGRHE